MESPIIVLVMCEFASVLVQSSGGAHGLFRHLLNPCHYNCQENFDSDPINILLYLFETFSDPVSIMYAFRLRLGGVGALNVFLGLDPWHSKELFILFEMFFFSN